MQRCIMPTAGFLKAKIKLAVIPSTFMCLKKQEVLLLTKLLFGVSIK